MGLSEEQIYNLTHFYFNINDNMDAPLINQSPSYIIEKWEKWISKDISPENYNPNIIPMNDLSYAWRKRWDWGDGEMSDYVMSIVKFISIYDSKDGLINLGHLFSLFNNSFPSIKIYEENGGVLHTRIESYMYEWMNHPSNQVWLRENHVDKLLTD